MFKSFFSVVREDHPQSLINSMSSIITSILEEIVDADHDPLDINSSHSLLDMIFSENHQGEEVCSICFLSTCCFFHTKLRGKVGAQHMPVPEILHIEKRCCSECD